MSPSFSGIAAFCHSLRPRPAKGVTHSLPDDEARPDDFSAPTVAPLRRKRRTQKTLLQRWRAQWSQLTKRKHKSHEARRRDSPQYMCALAPPMKSIMPSKPYRSSARNAKSGTRTKRNK